MIGLSYSLEADGSPGCYNRAIAELMEADYAALMESGETHRPWAGMQWEIWDALSDANREAIAPLGRVAAPPRFSEADIQDPCAQDLRRLLAWLNSPVDGKPEIAKALDRALDDASFAARFTGLQLPLLQRGGHRLVWVEERRLPTRFPLRPLQTWRVNRLIIERLCPGGVKFGRYLTARDVLRMLFEQVAKPGDFIGEIWIYSHPEHFPTCRDDATFVAGELGIAIGNFVGRTADRWPADFWDPQTAQSWCRSREIWHRYQADMRMYYSAAEP